MANGVEGLGDEASKLALYRTEDGQRGVLCVAPVAAGERLVRVPLSLGLPDQWLEADGPELFEGATWGVRLAAKLLREVKRGDASPRAPWFRVLPEGVGAPYFFRFDEVREIQYGPMREELDRYGWLVADGYRQAGGGEGGCEAMGGASKEEFEWAMALVHSRSFGLASEKGGIQTRMLLPFIDCFNHSGDQGFYTREAEVPVQSAQVFWELKGPDNEDNDTGRWCMDVLSDAPVAGNEEAHLCYGDRSNDDFFLHYGFVPLHNPHDDVILFRDVEGAIEWFTAKFLLGLDGAARAARADAARAAVGATVAAIEEAGDGGYVEGVKDLKVLCGARTDARLTAAFAGLLGAKLQEDFVLADETSEADWDSLVLTTALNEEHAEGADRAVAARCQEILDGFPTTLLQDLALLAGDLAFTDPNTEWARLSPAQQAELGEQLHFALLLAHFSGGERPAGFEVPEVTWTENLYKAVAYRAHKKLILTDAVAKLGGAAEAEAKAEGTVNGGG